MDLHASVFNACFYLSLFGYVAWAGAAIFPRATLDLALAFCTRQGRPAR